MNINETRFIDDAQKRAEEPLRVTIPCGGLSVCVMFSSCDQCPEFEIEFPQCKSELADDLRVRGLVLTIEPEVK